MSHHQLAILSARTGTLTLSSSSAAKACVDGGIVDAAIAQPPMASLIAVNFWLIFIDHRICEALRILAQSSEQRHSFDYLICCALSIAQQPVLCGPCTLVSVQKKRCGALFCARSGSFMDQTIACSEILVDAWHGGKCSCETISLGCPRATAADNAACYY